MTQKTSLRDDFEEEYLKWSSAILLYCRTQTANTAVQAAIQGSGQEMNESLLY